MDIIEMMIYATGGQLLLKCFRKLDKVEFTEVVLFIQNKLDKAKDEDNKTKTEQDQKD